MPFGENFLCATRLVILGIAKDPFHLGTFNIFLLIKFFSKNFHSIKFSHMTPSSCEVERYVIDQEIQTKSFKLRSMTGLR